MARIRKVEEPQFTPGTPEFTMGQEQRRQARQEEEELQEMYRVLQDLSVSPDLSSSERQEVDDLIDEFDQSGHGIQEAGFAGIGRAIGGAFKSPRAQKILGGIRQAPGVLRDKASALANRFGVGKGKAAAGPKSKAKDRVYPEWLKTDPNKLRWSSMTEAERAASRAASSAKGLATKAKTAKVKTAKDMAKGGAIVGGAGLIGSEFLDQAGGDEEPQQSEEYRREDVIIGPDDKDYRPPVSDYRPPVSTEDPEDTRTPRQKRKFISTPGRPRGAKRRNPFYVPPPGGEEADPEAAQRPGLPMTGVPGEQPEAIPDMTPTDQDIEGLFNGEGMPERFRDDPSKDAVSAAFLRERGKAFGDARGQIEGAPGLYEEPEGVDFIDTPEGQALLQSDVMPPELVKPDYMSDEEWATLSDAEKRRIMAEGDTSFASTFGAGTQ